MRFGWTRHLPGPKNGSWGQKWMRVLTHPRCIASDFLSPRALINLPPSPAPTPAVHSALSLGSCFSSIKDVL